MRASHTSAAKADAAARYGIRYVLRYVDLRSRNVAYLCIITSWRAEVFGNSVLSNLRPVSKAMTPRTAIDAVIAGLSRA